MQVLDPNSKRDDDWLTLWSKVGDLQTEEIKDGWLECWDQFLQVQVMSPLLTLQEQTI